MPYQLEHCSCSSFAFFEAFAAGEVRPRDEGRAGPCRCRERSKRPTRALSHRVFLEGVLRACRMQAPPHKTDGAEKPAESRDG